MPQSLPRISARVLINERHDAEAAAPRWIASEKHRAAREEIASWPGYAETPLFPLPGLARALGISSLHYKDESGRFGLGSFKALGGPYAVLGELRRRGRPNAITVTTATDGNHGRAVAWGAKMFGCRAVIYIPAVCSPARESAIAALGAEVVRCDGGYDAAVRRCAADAATTGRVLISDTSWDGYTEIPREVMRGYTVMAEEVLSRMPGPSHTFLQGGVGAFPAAVCGHYRDRLGANCPRIVVVEPDGAACLFASAGAGRVSAAPEPVYSVMAGLNCGEASPVAWEVLDRGAFAFMTVPDDSTAFCMRLLADAPFDDPSIVAGESAIAGLAALIGACGDDQIRYDLGLGAESRVLLFGTEGATDPDIYEEMVGRPPQAV